MGILNGKDYAQRKAVALNDLEKNKLYYQKQFNYIKNWYYNWIIKNEIEALKNHYKNALPSGRDSGIDEEFRNRYSFDEWITKDPEPAGNGDKSVYERAQYWSEPPRKYSDPELELIPYDIVDQIWEKDLYEFARFQPKLEEWIIHFNEVVDYQKKLESLKEAEKSKEQASGPDNEKIERFLEAQSAQIAELKEAINKKDQKIDRLEDNLEKILVENFKQMEELIKSNNSSGEAKAFDEDSDEEAVYEDNNELTF